MPVQSAALVLHSSSIRPFIVPSSSISCSTLTFVPASKSCVPAPPLSPRLPTFFRPPKLLFHFLPCPPLPSPISFFLSPHNGFNSFHFSLPHALCSPRRRSDFHSFQPSHSLANRFRPRSLPLIPISIAAHNLLTTRPVSRSIRLFFAHNDFSQEGRQYAVLWCNPATELKAIIHFCLLINNVQQNRCDPGCGPGNHRGRCPCQAPTLQTPL